MCDTNILTLVKLLLPKKMYCVSCTIQNFDNPSDSLTNSVNWFQNNYCQRCRINKKALPKH